MNAIAYSAAAEWKMPGRYDGRNGHYGTAVVEVTGRGLSSGGTSTPGGPLDDAILALAWLFAGDVSDDDGCLLEVESLDTWLDSERTDAVVEYRGNVFLFTDISWE